MLRSDSKPCGCPAILGKMEGESRECSTVADGPCRGTAILDVAPDHSATLDDGSRESSALLELGKVVG